MKWFVLQTQTNREFQVRDAINKLKEAEQSCKDKIGQILVPTYNTVAIKKNKRVIKAHKHYPGYILVEMDNDRDVIWRIRNVAGVTRFLGDRMKPVAMSEDEAKRMIELASEPATARPKPAVTFDKEEAVRIVEGPFANFIGHVEEVHEDKAKLKVMVTIFGRSTPVELEFTQVEKL